MSVYNIHMCSCSMSNDVHIITWKPINCEQSLQFILSDNIPVFYWFVPAYLTLHQSSTD